MSRGPVRVRAGSGYVMVAWKDTRRRGPGRVRGGSGSGPGRVRGGSGTGLWRIRDGHFFGLKFFRSLKNKLHSCVNDLLTTISSNIATMWLDIKLNQDLGCYRIFYGQNCMCYSSVVKYFIVSTLGGNYVS